nr:COP9 signalosome complex subunit 6 [Hymenolepis microstoma]CDS34715.1 COP9 signalosome complex subunit 6 [Hymenolepis microstoma]
MEVVEVPDPLVDTSNQHSISVIIHPLALLNASEHWMRLKLILDSVNAVAYGGLLGKHNGREVEIHNTFEMVVDDMVIDSDYLVDRVEKVRQLYKGLDVIGWYTNGKSLTEKNKTFHFQFTEKYECPYILILDPLDKTCERLPFRLYESGIDSLCQVYFKQVTFKVGNDPIESIGIDLLARVADVAKVTPDIDTSDNTDVPGISNPVSQKNLSKPKEVSETAETLQENHQAVQMLSNRLNVLRDYVDAVIRGELPLNHARLREIRALLVRLPQAVSSNGPFGDNTNHSSYDLEDQTVLLRQASDVCLTSLLVWID